MASKRPQKKSGLSIRPRYILLFFLLMFCILGGIYLSQQTKLSSIAEEKATLQTQLDALTVEQERLERMLEYMQTNDYLLQYAREKLGYVYADDYKFYDESTTGTGGAVNVPEPSTEPVETPVPFGVPTDDSEDVYYEPLPIGNGTQTGGVQPVA